MILIFEYLASKYNSDNAHVQERAAAASTPKDIARFEKYGRAVCGEERVPHLIVDRRINHAGEIHIPAICFLYITGTIDWAWRSYLIARKKIKNAWDNEIHIDFNLARKYVMQAAAWPLMTDKE